MFCQTAESSKLRDGDGRVAGRAFRPFVGMECDKLSKLSHTESHKAKEALGWRASESLQLVDFIGADERT